MKKLLLLVALILSFAFNANAVAASGVICKIVSYTNGLGGQIVTIVIIGAALALQYLVGCHGQGFWSS